MKHGLIFIHGVPVYLASTERLLDALGYESTPHVLRENGFPPLAASIVMQDDENVHWQDVNAFADDSVYENLQPTERVMHNIDRCLLDIKCLRDRPLQSETTGGNNHHREMLVNELSEINEELLSCSSSCCNSTAFSSLGAGERILFARSLNSLRVVTPILLYSFEHTRRRDSKLVVGMGRKLHVKNRKKQTKCWFLGETKYQVVAKKDMTKQLHELERLLARLGTIASDVHLSSSDVWRRDIDLAMEWYLRHANY